MTYSKSLLVEFLFFLVLEVMDSQDPYDLELSLSQLPVEAFQPSQPSTSRRRAREEAGPSERRVQPRSDLGFQQPPLGSPHSNARALVIVLEAEATLQGGYQVVFEGCFQNTNEGQTVRRSSNEMNHRLWLHGPLNHLTRERRARFIVAVLRQILEFLHV